MVVCFCLQHQPPAITLLHHFPRHDRSTLCFHLSSKFNMMTLHCYWLVCLAFFSSVHSFSTIPRHPTKVPSFRLASLPPTLETLVADTLNADRKIVVVTGGVLSGIGKGVTASSIGVVSRKCTLTFHTYLVIWKCEQTTMLNDEFRFTIQLFRAMGYRVTAIKIDPYLNVDAGTMSPFEHGEGTCDRRSQFDCQSVNWFIKSNS